ncbi:MAG: non-ribosomal peptide synthetase, partial [bacterium]|nr:non-ribosomal peptide synthetase [bacterium]
ELPDYMLPTHYVKLKKMPLTSTGKIDRKALPQPANLETGKQYTPPRNETEKKLAKIWTQILGMPENKIGIDMDFFHLGGHSLKATILIAHVHKEFEVEIPLSAIFKKTTIRTIAQHITKTEKSTFTGLEKAAEHEFYPLSPAQQRLYILQQLDEKGTGYNLPMVMELEGKLDIEKLTHAYKEMIRRHESLRTAFLMVEEKPVQKIHPEVEFSIETYGETYGKTSGGNPNEPATNNGNRAENSDTETVIRRFIRPFDLTRAPLLRVGLLIPGATHDSPHRNRHILMMDMHHIISDGTSNMLFINEFIALYGGESLPPLKYQYRDYSQWRNSDTHRTKIKRQEDYWLEVFSGEIPQLELPGDYPRPAVQGFEGSTLRFEIGPKETGALKKLTQTEGVTQYMLLLAGITIWL